MAEWLKATDCKSVAPWSYGGSNPPLCTRDLVLKLWIALSAFLLLAVLAWQTLDDGNIRLITLAILFLLALKTVTHEMRMRAESGGD